MTLEDLLKKACEKGLTHLTVWPIPSADGKKIYWIAKATPSAAYGYVQSENLDPVKALTTVLENLPAAKKRKVTATVREPTRDPELDAKIDPNRGSTYSEPAKLNEELDAWLPKT